MFKFPVVLFYDIPVIIHSLLSLPFRVVPTTFIIFPHSFTVSYQSIMRRASYTPALPSYLCTPSLPLHAFPICLVVRWWMMRVMVSHLLHHILFLCRFSYFICVYIYLFILFCVLFNIFHIRNQHNRHMCVVCRNVSKSIEVTVASIWSNGGSHKVSNSDFC